jgi:hypothetical protein
LVVEQTVAVENRAGLAAGSFRAWESLLASQVTIKRALDWFFAQQPPLAPADIIAQDEFSFDILVPTDGLYLAYDTG